MKTLEQKISFSLLVMALSVSTSLWASEIQGPETEKVPYAIKIINGVIEYEDYPEGSDLASDRGVTAAATSMPTTKTKSLRRKSGKPISRQKTSRNGDVPKSPIDKNDALQPLAFACSSAALQTDILLAGLLPQGVQAHKREFTAPLQIDLVDFILIACAGEQGMGLKGEIATKKYNKVYLPYQQMTAGFYEPKVDDLKGIAECLHVSPEDLEMKPESLANLRMAIRYDDIIQKPVFNKVKEGLMVTKAEDIKNFTKKFLIGLQDDLRKLEAEVRTLGVNFHLKRILNERRNANTLGDSMQSTFGFYQTYLGEYKLPDILVSITFAVEKDAYMLKKVG